MEGIAALKGKVLKSIIDNNDEIIFESVDGEQWKMYHSQDCCESVYVEEIIGDFSDLLDTEILDADESTCDSAGQGDLTHVAGDDSEQWTFYRIRTIKGSVTIRWYGCSNGYYSVNVSFYKVA